MAEATSVLGQDAREPARLREENQSLRAQLEEAQETLRAIQEGAVDALVIDTPEGQKVFTLQGADQTYRLLLERMHEGAATLTAGGIIHFCNQALADMLGRPLQQIIGTPVLRHVAAADQPAFQAMLSQGLAGHAWGEVGLAAANGDAIPAQIGLSPLNDAGDSVSVSIIVTDLRKQKWAERLAASEERLRRIAQAGQVGFFEWNATKDTSYWSPEHYDLFGYERGSPIAWERWLASVHPEDRDRVAQNAARLLDRGHAEGAVRGHKDEYRFVRADGSVAWLESDVSLNMVGGEAIVRGSVRNVTERKRAEEEIVTLNRDLRRRVTELQAIFETAPLALAIAEDAEGHHIRGNPANERMLGVGTGGELSKNASRSAGYRCLYEGRELAVTELPMQRAVRGETVAGQVLEVVREDGQLLTLYGSAAPLFDEAGKPRGAVGAFLDITPLKQAEEALRVSQERLTLAVSGTRIGMFDWNLATHETFWTEQHARLFGLTTTTTTTTTLSLAYQYSDWAERVHPEDLPRVESEVRRCIAEHSPFEAEYRVVWPDGSEHWVATRGVFQYDALDAPQRMLGIVMDITERKQADEALAAAHRQTQNILDNTTAIVYAFDLEERFVVANAAVAKLLNSTPAQMIGKRRHNFMPQADADWHEANDREVIEAGRALDFEEQSELPGRSITWLTTKFPLRDTEGKIYAVGGFSTDISERKRTEEVLRKADHELKRLVEELEVRQTELEIQNEELRVVQAELDAGQRRYFDLYDFAPVGYFTLGDQGLILEANLAAAKVLGVARGDLVKQPLPRFILPEDQDIYYLHRKGLLATGKPQECELRMVRNDGMAFWVHLITTTQSADGTPVCRAVVSDITDRKQAEEAVRRQAAILVGVNRILAAALSCETEHELGSVCLEVAEEITQSRFGFIGDVNETGLEDIVISNPGWDACSILDANGHRVPLGSFPIHGIYGRVLSDGKPVLANDPANHPDRIGLPAGHPPLTAFLGVPLLWQGQVRGMIAVGNREGGYTLAEQESLEALAPAIVEAFMRLRARKELRETGEDLARSNHDLQQFAHVVSHDLKEPLRMVTGFMSLLQDHCRDKLDAKAKEFIGIATDAATRMTELIDDLLAYGRAGREDVRASADLALIVDRALKNLTVSIQDSGAVITHDPLPVIASNGVELTQVFQNLVGNALKFRGERAPEIHIGAERQEGQWLFTVRDNGIGIDPQFADRIFLIFERLHVRRKYSGTGIGLAICKKIVERHGGRIWVESAVGAGATFCFTIADSGKE